MIYVELVHISRYNQKMNNLLKKDLPCSNFSPTISYKIEIITIFEAPGGGGLLRHHFAFSELRET